VHAPSGLESSLVARLYHQAKASRWDLPKERFEAALAASLANARAAGNAALNAEQYLSGLHLEDLALAAACAAGQEAAWDYFVGEYRTPMDRAATAIDPTAGSDLSGSLYAELFGLETRDGERKSLFRYFHGRSRLGTWLRAILAQRHIDRIRVARRHEPLPEEEHNAAVPSVLTTREQTEVAGAERTRFLEAIRESLVVAIAALPARDRLMLGCYYAQEMTLAAIGRMLHEHEATISRHLARTRREIRKAAEKRLRARHGLDDGALSECFRSVTEDAGALDLAELLGKTADRKKLSPNRSKK
jgi:RNA polymerase sigma-70 factor (ECF subfamily)